MTAMLLEWVATSVFLILVVLALRGLLKKRISAGLRYALWAVVLVRLLVPVQLFTSPVAGTRVFAEVRMEQNVGDPADGSNQAEQEGGQSQQGGSAQIGGAVQTGQTPALPGGVPNPPQTPTAPDAPAAPRPTAELLAALGRVWLAGAVGMALVFALANLRFARRLRRVRIPMDGADCPLRAYAAVGLDSPCLFGLVRPAVYVTPEAAADPEMLRHVLAHEVTHFRHLDHLWNLLRCAALAVHWWNPLVWLAVALSRRDGELACDEGALKRLGDGERKAYGRTLLALVTARPRPRDLLCCATTMAGDKKSLMERVSRIAKAPRRLLWAAVAAVLILALACACAFGRAAEPEETPDGGEENEPPQDPAELVYELDWSGGPNSVDLELPEYPGVVFHCDGYTVTAVTGAGEQTLYGGMPVCSIYLCDLNGDGKRELCSEVLFGSGAVDSRIRVYDYAGQTLYELANRMTYDYTLRLEEERLWAEERGYDPNVLQGSGRYRAGPLVLTEQGLEIRQETPPEGGEPLAYTPDLNRNGVPETMQVCDILYEGQTRPDGKRLEVWEDGKLIWSDEGYMAHAGWNAVFLCTLDGQDYLLRYHPTMYQGSASYQYKLFTLEGGQETVVRENSVGFDTQLNSPLYNGSFDPDAIADFMEEINGLLSNSVQLINTDMELSETFEKEGRLYDSLYWLDLDYTRAPDKTLRENLRDYQAAMEGAYYVDQPEIRALDEENRHFRLFYHEKSVEFGGPDFAYQYGMNPQVMDLNRDGRDEIVFTANGDHSNGFRQESLYIFDAETLERYDTAHIGSQVYDQLQSTGDEENFYLSAPGMERVTLPKSIVKDDPPYDHHMFDAIEFAWCYYYDIDPANGTLSYLIWGNGSSEVVFCAGIKVELKLTETGVELGSFEFLPDTTGEVFYTHDLYAA